MILIADKTEIFAKSHYKVFNIVNYFIFDNFLVYISLKISEISTEKIKKFQDFISLT